MKNDSEKNQSNNFQRGLKMKTEIKTVQDNNIATEQTEEQADLPISEPVETEIDNQEQEQEQEEQEEQELTVEAVEEFLDTEDGQRLLQPILDRFFNKGLQTWKEKHLEQVLADHDAEQDRLKKNPKVQELMQVQKQLDFENRVDSLLDKIKEHKQLLPLGIAETLANFESVKAFSLIDQLVDDFKKSVPSLVKNEVDKRFGDLKGRNNG
ncbi:MAG: hypothetical protein PWQ06_1111 [Anaerophaga sp.]|nr:hypothetical protein [Anaerophaga sp.]